MEKSLEKSEKRVRRKKREEEWSLISSFAYVELWIDTTKRDTALLKIITFLIKLVKNEQIFDLFSASQPHHPPLLFFSLLFNLLFCIGFFEIGL